VGYSGESRPCAHGPREPPLSTSDPKSPRADEQPVLNIQLVASLLTYVDNNYGPATCDAAIADAGLTREEFSKKDHWVSSNVVRRLNHAMVERCQNPMLLYEAGMATIAPEYIGGLYYALRTLGTPSLVYRQLQALNAPMSKITNWEIVEIGSTRAVLRFQVSEGHSDDEHFCLNRQGALAGIPKGLGLPPARVEHPVCLHRGGECCEYHVSWQGPDLLLRSATALVVFAGLAAGLAITLGWISAGWLPVVMGGFLALAGYATWSFRRQYLASSAATAKYLEENKRGSEAEYQRYRDLATLTKIDRLTRQQLQVDDLIATALEEITNTLGYERVLFMSLDERDRVLRHAHSVGYPPALLELVSAWEAALDHPSEDARFLGNIARRQEGTLVEDIGSYREAASPETRALLDALGTRAFMAMPVTIRDQVLGLVIVEQAESSRVLSRQDLELLGQLAHLLGLALDNARKVEALQTRTRELEAALLLAQKYSQYLPGPVVERLREDPSLALELGGEPIRATVLFSDIKGFTQWAKDREPSVVVRTLNRYFAAMDEVIASTGGILDKRMGDGLMVVFLHATGQDTDCYEPDVDGPRGAADPLRHPACRAVDCALQMQEAVAELVQDPVMADFPGLRIRIGVAHGDLVAGNLGSHHRLEYTVIGDVVNVASRLEALCPPGAVLTTRATQLCATGAPVRAEPFGEHELKGREGAVELVRLRPAEHDEA
jgi:class 3 adenylate cyclase